MKESKKYLIVTIIALVVFGGILSLTVKTELEEDKQADKYKKIIDSFDSSIKSLKTNQSPGGTFSTIKNNYDNIVISEYENRKFDNDQDLITLDNNIENDLKNFSSVWQTYRLYLRIYRQKFGVDTENYLRARNQLYNRSENATPIDEVIGIKSDISTVFGELGVGLPIVYQQPALTVLALMFLLALLVTLGCRKFINWNSITESRKTLETWREGLEGSQNKGKRRKEEVENEKARENHEMVWRESFKQGLFYLFPFLALLGWLFEVYGGTSLAWVPFESLYSISWIGVSLDIMGWSILCYFVFSYILRFFLLPEKQ